MDKIIEKLFNSFKRKKSLIDMASKAIQKYHKSVTFERTYFEVVLVNNGNVEIIGLIDGGPLVDRKVCSNIQEVNDFISKTIYVYQ